MRKTLILLAIVPMFAALTGLSACAKFPELDAAISDEAKAADYPNLVPASQIAKRRTDGRLKADEGAQLLARAERLRKRGEILRGLPVIDEAARLRFARVLENLGG